MTRLLLITWLVLSLATLISWWLDASMEGVWVGTAVLLVAFFKARMVLMVFMEVREATPALRWICEAWVATACAAVIATYWFAPFALAN
jgi:hypothetical protein